MAVDANVTQDTAREIESTLGVSFLGFIISIVLYGLTTFRT